MFTSDLTWGSVVAERQRGGASRKDSLMRRTFFAVIATLALVVGLTSVASAASTLSGSARLTAASTNVLPGQGAQAPEFSVDVSNTSQAGLLPDQGPRVNYVNIILPSAAGITTNPSVQAPSGWTAEITDQGSLQTVKFRATGSGIAPGGTQRFTFPANVAAPSSGDVSGDFRVAISDNGGQTTEPARGDLTTIIRVLEVVSLGALSPAGVTDQSATGDQSITYGVTVRNHATQALTVTPSLTSDQSDTIGTAAPVSIASTGSKTFDFPVTLGSQGSGERTSKFTGGASSADAAAVSKDSLLTVQAPPGLSLDATSFTPKFVRASSLISYEFGVTANKTQPPTLRLNTCTLSFADTTTSLAAPVTFDAGSRSQTLSFASTNVAGSEESHPVRIQCQGVDGNDHPVSYDLRNLVVTIDNTAPLVTVELIKPSGQEAVKNGDTVRVTGTVDEVAQVDFVRLRPNRGDDIPCTVGGGESTTFSCQVSPTFEAGTTSVHAEAQVTDKAGNIGGAASTPVVVDLKKPELNFAQTLSGKQILIRFEDQTAIRGGCNPTQWTVNGHVVSRVLFSNGTECTSPPGPRGAQGAEGSNFRILVLADELADRDETPLVKYTRDETNPLADNVADAALNIADTASITSIPGILPPAPEISDSGNAVTRTDHVTGEREAAYREQGTGTKPDTDTYWTNRAGSDLLVGFTGGKAGYKIQAVDGNGNPVGDPQEITASSGSGTLTVSIGTSDGRFVRGIRLINAAGAGPATFFDVALDRVTPDIVKATGADDKVTVGFSEVLPVGTDFANDWYAWENVPGGRDFYQSQRVDRTGNLAERILTVAFDNRGPFGGALYLFTSGGFDGQRYEDRAGNFLSDGDSS